MLCCLARNIHSEPGKGKLSSFLQPGIKLLQKQASVDSLAKEKRGFQVNTSCFALICTKQNKMLKCFCKCTTAFWHQVFSRKQVSLSRCSHDVRKRCKDLGRCVTLGAPTVSCPTVALLTLLLVISSCSTNCQIRWIHHLHSSNKIRIHSNLAANLTYMVVGPETPTPLQ